MVLKVANINVYSYPFTSGGATVVANKISKLMNGHGIQLFNIGSDPRYNYKDTKIFYDDSDIKSYIIPVSQPNSYEAYHRNEDASRYISSIFDLESPDVALCHSIQIIGVDFVKNIKKSVKRLYLVVHDAWWICEQQFMIHSKGIFCGQSDGIDLNVCGYCTENVDRMNRRLVDLSTTFHLFDGVIYVSAYMKRLYEKSGLLHRNTAVINNIVDEATDQPNQNGFVKLNVGYSGGSGRLKGIDSLVQVAEYFLDNNFVRFIVAGADTDTNLISKFDHLLGRNVRFTASYHPQNVDAWYSKIDVLFCPSIVPESSGLAIREALLRGVWPIAGNIGGACEVVTHRENGSLVSISSENVDEIIEEIHYLLGRKFYKKRALPDHKLDKINAYLQQYLSFIEPNVEFLG